MKSMGMIFKTSLLLLIFMCGVMTGRAVEEKRTEEIEKIVGDLEVQPQNILMSWVEGIEVYFDSWEDGEVHLIVNNREGNKLQEVSIVNMEIDGIKVETYSDLTGINTGEMKRCTISYDGKSMTEQGPPTQIKGELYVRGSKNYVYQKIFITI